ncbi:unnamed protein product [Arctogadus glacialis]
MFRITHMQINLEFMRLTTVPLTSKFLGELDRLTDDLIRVFHTKGGAAGRKIIAVMAKTHNSKDINVSRDCVLSCLSIYLNEDLGPYFNGLKRKWKAQSASSFVGGSTALLLFYRRINDTSAAAQVSKGLV